MRESLKYAALWWAEAEILMTEGMGVQNIDYSQNSIQEICIWTISIYFLFTEKFIKPQIKLKRRKNLKRHKRKVYKQD